MLIISYYRNMCLFHKHISMIVLTVVQKVNTLSIEIHESWYSHTYMYIHVVKSKMHVNKQLLY